MELVKKRMDKEMQRLLRMASVAQIGWWESDFSAEHYVCSDYLCDLLQIEGDTISFRDFHELIREDFRDQIVEEFNGNIHREFYEQTFPLMSKYGMIWVHTRLAHREDIPGRGPVSFGILQRVENQDLLPERIRKQVSQLGTRQNSISKTLLRFLKNDSIESGITAVLYDVLTLFEGERVYIFEYDRQYTYQCCTYEVVAAGVEPQKDNLQHLPTAMLPWWTQQTLAARPVILDSLDQLPDHAMVEYEVLHQQNIKSLMVIPMIIEERVWGYMGIDLVTESRNWTNEDFQWLSSLANIISICIELRKTKDDAIQERTFLRNLFTYMPLGFLRISLVRDEEGEVFDFRITDANLITTEMVGLAPADFIGRLGSYFHEDPRQALGEILRVLDDNVHQEQTIFFPRTDCQARCILYSPDHEEVIALLLDSTEMIRAHKALDRSEKLFKSIFANIPIGVEIYDKEGTLVDLNNMDMEIFGVQNKSDVLGVSFFDNPNIPEEIKERVQREDIVDFRVKYSFSRAMTYYHAKKEDAIELYAKVSKLFDKQGNFNGYVILNIDNTDRLDAINRVRDFENFFLLISEFAKVGYAKINVITKEGYAIKQWYKNMGEREDLPLSNVMGVYSKLHPEDRELVLAYFAEIVEGTRTNFSKEVRVLQPGTTDGWNWISMNVVLTNYDPAHDLVEIIGINYDITELKETEILLTEAKNKAETMDRLKSAFIANMSHEIRTPLNAIVGFSHLLTEEIDAGERQQYIKIIQDNTDHLLSLIADVLNLSKMDAGTLDLHFEPLDVCMLCDEIITSMQSKVPERVELVFDCRDLRHPIVTDYHLLYQLLSNLVNNALKFTMQGSVHIGYERQERGLRFYVRDTGIGIAEDQRTRIFERFVKVNNFIPGTGLGLSICQSIVERLGGEIGVESELGKGSTFWFTLPAPSPSDSEQ